MLTTTQITRLEALRNRLTGYEVAAVRADGSRALVGYTRRHSGQGARALAENKREAILAYLGPAEHCTVKRSRNGWDFSDGSKITFTGRTERDAIQMGELPPVGT